MLNVAPCASLFSSTQITIVRAYFARHYEVISGDYRLEVKHRSRLYIRVIKLCIDIRLHPHLLRDRHKPDSQSFGWRA